MIKQAKEHLITLLKSALWTCQPLTPFPQWWAKICFGLRCTGTSCDGAPGISFLRFCSSWRSISILISSLLRKPCTFNNVPGYQKHTCSVSAPVADIAKIDGCCYPDIPNAAEKRQDSACWCLLICEKRKVSLTSTILVQISLLFVSATWSGVHL